MANAPLDAHTGWVGSKVPSTTITDAWVGTQKVFGKLWRSTRQEKDNDATMADAKSTKSIEEAPSAGTKESENAKNAIMNDVEEYKDTKETHGEGKLDICNNKDKVDKLMPATPTKRISALKKTLKFTVEGKLSTLLFKGIMNKLLGYTSNRDQTKNLSPKMIFIRIRYLKLTLT